MSTPIDPSDSTPEFDGYYQPDENREEKDRPVDHLLYFLSDNWYLLRYVIGLGFCLLLYYGVPAVIRYLNHCDWSYVYPTG